MYTYFLAIR